MPGVRRWPTERAGVLVVRPGRLALIRRERDGQTYYVVPGGSIEPKSVVRMQHDAKPSKRSESQSSSGRSEAVWTIEPEASSNDSGTSRRESDTDEITVTGPELTHSADRGTFTATWVRIDELVDHPVHPPVVADLVRQQHDVWPATAIEIIEDCEGARDAPIRARTTDTSTNIAALAAVIIVAVLEFVVQTVEEPYLTRTHGQRYTDRASRSGRFLPGLGKLHTQLG